jgi:putative nucleotidyltransferase with HDIG domain
LRLANAPANGMSRRIASARHAVMVLGFELVRSLAALTASGLVGNDRKAAPPGFWSHSLATAAGAMVVARHTGRNEGDACSAGLLHDLGAALLYRAAPAVYDQMVAETADDPLARTAVEEARFELAHPEAGAAVLSQWHFPDEMLEVVSDHHRLPLPVTGDLVLVVRAGEAIGDLAVLVDPGESIPDPVEALRAAGLEMVDDDSLPALVVEVDEQLRALRAVLA